MAEKIKVPTDETPKQKLARLDAEREELAEALKADALAKINEGIDELSALGFRFVLSEADRVAVNYAPKNTTCSVCQLRTDPPHDKRSHKGHPERFTAEEIAEKGWQIVQ